MLDERIKTFLKTEKLCDENFFDYIENKIVYLPSDSDTFWYGCHPILENNIIKDIRVVVPEIKTEKDILINIHEFTHALELYYELETVYEERREEREKLAQTMEKQYLKQKI